MSWPLARLDECGEVVGGATPKTSDPRYWDGDIRWVTPKELSGLNGIYFSETERRITDDGLRSCSAQVLPPGSVLLSTRAPIGHTAINSEPMATNQGFKSIVPDPRQLDARYLLYWFRANRARLEAMGSGATFKELSKKRVSEIQLPLPPLEEQRRMADVLDQADALRAKRRAAMERVESLKQSIFLDMFGDPLHNPKSWPMRSLGEIVSFIGGGTPRRANPEYFEGDICWATSKDMKGEYLVDTQEHITESAIQQSATNLVPAGTILIVVKSKVLMHSLPLLITRVPTCFGQDIKGIGVNEGWSIPYVVGSIRSLKRLLLKRARGVNTEGLTLEHLRSLSVMSVPGELQEAYEARWAAVDATRGGQKSSIRSMDELFASVQEKAFAGVL